MLEPQLGTGQGAARATASAGTALDFGFEVALRGTSVCWKADEHKLVRGASQGRERWGLQETPLQRGFARAGCGLSFSCSALGTAWNHLPWALGCLWEGS